MNVHLSECQKVDNIVKEIKMCECDLKPFAQREKLESSERATIIAIRKTKKMLIQELKEAVKKWPVIPPSIEEIITKSKYTI